MASARVIAPVCARRHSQAPADSDVSNEQPAHFTTDAWPPGYGVDVIGSGFTENNPSATYCSSPLRARFLMPIAEGNKPKESGHQSMKSRVRSK
jgi:hypothetical protein